MSGREAKAAPLAPPPAPEAGVDYDPNQIDKRGKVWSMLDIVIGVFVVWSGYRDIRYSPYLTLETTNWGRIVTGAYLCLFGLLLILSAFIWQRWLFKWLPFLYTFFGRGMLLFLLGFATLGAWDKGKQGISVAVSAIGLVYGILSFVANIPVPMPLMYSRKAIAQYEKDHPKFREALHARNKKRAERKMQKQYKQEVNRRKKESKQVGKEKKRLDKAQKGIDRERASLYERSHEAV